MAVPSFLHRNPALRWMAWRRVTVIAQRLRQALRAVANGDPTVVMDFGCGTGVLLGECNARADKVYGVDIVLRGSQLMVEEWQLDKVALLTPAQAEEAVPAGSVDVIVAAEVLEHVEPLAPTLALFSKWLKPTGKLLVSVPTENALYRFGRRLAGFSGHYHHSNAAAIHREVTAAGFVPRRLEKIPWRGPFSIYWVIDYQRP